MEKKNKRIIKGKLVSDEIIDIKVKDEIKVKKEEIMKREKGKLVYVVKKENVVEVRKVKGESELKKEWMI